ncbi:MAG: SRPBCC family protein [Gordonia sp. (in: high G+C Gram-positive bacteria)]
MSEVKHKAVVDAPREQVFAYVSTYQNVPEYMFGITKFEPVTAETRGVGATFATEMNVGPKTLKSTVKTIEYTENEYLELTSVEGFSSGSSWRFADAGEGQTEVDVRFSYALPGGLAGKVLKPILETFMGQAVKATEKNIREKAPAYQA